MLQWGMNYIIDVYYDKECPFCNNYAQVLQLKQNHTLRIVNARQSHNKIHAFKQKGFDINEGMIIEVNNNRIYQGADAIAFLNQCASKPQFIYDTNLFKYMIYPCIKLVRKLILWMLGKNTSL
jgi:predicted DCC family thiol-disulfide oxidoreductase YuxK